MNALDRYMDKRNCLDLLAYLLCDENLTHELGSNCIDLSIKLYKEILEDLKKQAGQWKNESSKRNNFGLVCIECQELASLFFLEKRLEMIEQDLIKNRDIVQKT